MNNQKFINKETWDIVDELDDYIPVDSKIAKTIGILNKKGYVTKSSCAGHHDIRFIDIDEADISLLEEFKRDSKVIIRDVHDDDFDYWMEIPGSVIYIVFADNYKLPSIPEGFVLDGDTLKHNVEYYNNDIRRSIPLINEEINKYNKILESWASSLPNIRKDD